MNVTDVSSPELHGDLKVYAETMVLRQSELEDSYWRIENRPSKIIEIDSREGQFIIKDYLWRITEEIGEALEASSLKESEWKIWEEIADALHFVIGLGVITGIEFLFIKAFTETKGGHWKTPYAVSRYVEQAGVLGNTLKLKPWKQTDVITDKEKFFDLYTNVVIAFLQVARSFNMDPDLLYDFYWRKSEVNKFRIRSMY